MSKAKQAQETGATILVVDDIPNTVEVISRNLKMAGHEPLTAGGVEEAVAILGEQEVDLVITDYKMPNATGLDLVRHVRANHPDTEVMMITGFASVNGAVKAVKTGADEYLAKPFTDEELHAAVGRSLDKLKLRRAGGPARGSGEMEDHGLIGCSDSMNKLFSEMNMAASSPVTVLITGETGTGKELVARAIHYASDRAHAPFVPVNCGGIPEGLLERELFGHVKGAFTGATESRAGFFQTASGGTVFLDEVSETSVAMQVKLLRVLQEKEIRMIGDSRTLKLDLRIVAATNKPLADLVAQGRFREDLFYRLAVVTFEVPPLRDRGGDVLLLARHFAQKFSHEFNRPVPVFGDAALQALLTYDWPGNVRELENLVQRVCVMGGQEEISLSDLPHPMRYSFQARNTLKRSLRQVELEHIRKVLGSVNDNKSQAARILGISRKTLREKLKDS